MYMSYAMNTIGNLKVFGILSAYNMYVRYEENYLWKGRWEFSVLLAQKNNKKIVYFNKELIKEDDCRKFSRKLCLKLLYLKKYILNIFFFFFKAHSVRVRERERALRLPVSSLP